MPTYENFSKMLAHAELPMFRFQFWAYTKRIHNELDVHNVLVTYIKRFDNL